MSSLYAIGRSVWRKSWGGGGVSRPKEAPSTMGSTQLIKYHLSIHTKEQRCCRLDT